MSTDTLVSHNPLPSSSTPQEILAISLQTVIEKLRTLGLLSGMSEQGRRYGSFFVSLAANYPAGRAITCWIATYVRMFELYGPGPPLRSFGNMPISFTITDVLSLAPGELVTDGVVVPILDHTTIHHSHVVVIDYLLTSAWVKATDSAACERAI